MIKANELRIGNWINNPIQGIDFQLDITCLSKIHYDDSNKQMNPKDKFQPIPLTEEWLIKFGLEIILPNDYPKCYYLKSDGFRCSWFKIVDNDGFNYEGTELKHVHQLQNLYFALTGEELTINAAD